MLVTVDEVAEMGGVSRQQIYKLTYEGRFPGRGRCPVRFGTTIRFKRDDVLQYIEDQASGKAA